MPAKNLRQINGVPLYRLAIEQGLRVADECIVSTDIPEIFESAMPPNCRVVRRADHLAADETPIEPVILDIIRREGLDKEVLVLLQATSPLRLDEDITEAIQLHATNKHDLVMTITATDVGILKYGTLSGDRFVPVSRPEYCFANRQSLPSVFRPNGAVYVFTAESFVQNAGMPKNRIGSIEMPRERSKDIDTIEDFNAVCGLLSRRHHHSRFSSPAA